MRVSLFVTCLVDQLFPQVGLDTVKVLRKLGLQVDFDPRQTCCSQPAFNSGFQSEAARVGRSFLEVYGGCEDPIVVPSGSCAAMLKVSLPHLFEPGSEWHRLARQVADRTWELSSFLVDCLGVDSTGAVFPEKVTYHDSCHLLRELGHRDQARRLIRSVQGIQLVEMEQSDRCCGFGGTFSVKYPEISAAMGREKLDRIRESGAGWVVAGDSSCLLHLHSLSEAAGVALRTLHLAELLARF